MYRLRALIWKTYKVRLKSPFSTTLDICGPIVIILLYLCVKLLFGTVVGVDTTPSTRQLNLGTEYSNEIPYQEKLIGDPNTPPLDPRQDLSRHLCTNVLLVEERTNTNSALKKTIEEQCGIKLSSLDNLDTLINQLRKSIQQRIDFRPSTSGDLNRDTLKQQSCFSVTNDKEPNYQAGILLRNDKLASVFLTDSILNTVIEQPYTEGSAFNEFRFPQSDLNAGLHLLEICIASAIEKSQPQSGGGEKNDTSEELKWRVRAFPVITASSVTSTLVMVFILIAHFCNAISTVLRCSEDNENGLHDYVRSAGVPAGIYWFSQMVVMTIHMVIQSLILSLLLAIPTSGILFDPLYEANITIRFLLLLTYGIALNVHAIFVGSLLTKVSHALLATSLLAICYAMYPTMYLLRSSPYEFSDFTLLMNFLLLNPVSNYQAILQMLLPIYIQTNEPLNWYQMNTRMIGGDRSNWTLGELWILLVAQSVVWFCLTVLVDQIYYSSSFSIQGLIINLFNETFGCCCPCALTLCGPDNLSSLAMRSKSRSTQNNPTPNGAKKELTPNESISKSAKDPNRICCSLRQVSVSGPQVMTAHTKGDVLKLTQTQLNELKQSSKSSQYWINAARISSTTHKASATLAQHQQLKKNHNDVGGGGGGGGGSNTTTTTANNNSASNSRVSHVEEPILLDESMEQHIVWHKSKVLLDNLNLDFRFNQVSFVLGQTDSKDLLFEALLGLRPFQSGHVLLDGTKFTSSTMALARPHIGYLGERDIFLNELKIFDNLQFFGSLRDPAYNRYDSESLFLLALLHLSSRKNALPSSLTSRSARKLALAAAAVGHTKLLLLVEPTLSLRWKPRCQVLNLLKKYKSIRSIIVDTSDVDEACAFGDRVILLKNGQAQMDGPPDKLRKKLTCGHWIVFDPIPLAASNNQTSPVPLHAQTSKVEENLKALELLTSEMFKRDKLENLYTTPRSVYQELMKGVDADVHEPDHHEALTKKAHESKETDDNLEVKRKTTVILKVRQSANSDVGLCNLLKLSREHKIVHGFRLAEMTYESLEDVLVMRMSKARYPDLPPDLLLSLQHRTQRQQESANGPAFGRAASPQDQEQPQISVRKHPTPKVLKSVFSANFKNMLKNRLSNRWELTLYLIAFIVSLIILACALISLQVSFQANHAHDMITTSGRVESSSVTTVVEVPVTTIIPTMVGKATNQTSSATTTTTKISFDWLPDKSSSSSTTSSPSHTHSSNNSNSARNESLAGERDPEEVWLDDSTKTRLAVGEEEKSLDEIIEAVYKYRIGLFIITDGKPLKRESSNTSENNQQSKNKTNPNNNNNNKNQSSSPSTASTSPPSPTQLPHTVNSTSPSPSRLTSSIRPTSYLDSWNGNKKLSGFIKRDSIENDVALVGNIIQASKDLVASIIFYDPTKNEATVLFEPQLPHSMIAGIRAFINYYSSLLRTKSNTTINKLNSSSHSFQSSSSSTSSSSFVLQQQLEQQQTTSVYNYVLEEPPDVNANVDNTTMELQAHPHDSKTEGNDKANHNETGTTRASDSTFNTIRSSSGSGRRHELFTNASSYKRMNDDDNNNNNRDRHNHYIDDSALINGGVKMYPSQGNLKKAAASDDKQTAEQARGDAIGNTSSSNRTRARQQHPSIEQSWHEILRGHLSRRLFYGLGFAFAEALTIGACIIAPIRHRSESRVVKVRALYWFAMALFDMILALIHILAYTILIIAIDHTYSASLITCIITTLFLYKLSSIPIAYLVSLVAESRVRGFLFIVLIYITIGWVFSVHLRTFIQWTLSTDSYLYTISSWIVLIVPISSLIDALADINHINSINQLCEKVPAYLATTNIVPLDGIQKTGMSDKLMLKVRECLANGKRGIDTNVIHHKDLGILWNLYLIVLFGIILWMFLLFSESVFGLIARRFNTSQNASDPMKTLIRSNESTKSLFKWDREKDRLISEYIRCFNEIKYVKQMASNCLYLRIWLRPMSDQTTINERLILLMEPLIKLGQPKNDIQIELKTTLQLFVRIGSETNSYKVDRVKLIETYSQFIKDHNDFVIKFAVVDWTRETLYKILLHGHYNVKSTMALG